MIQFKGYLTGNAEKRYFRKSIEFTRYIALASLLIGLLCYPSLMKVLSRIPAFQYLVYGFYGLCLLSPLWLRIPQSGKRRLANTPNTVTIEDDFIICATDRSRTGREVSHVKTVRDHGAFYELVFPLGQSMGVVYICQKDLLTQGSLEEFEKLFEGKIVSVKEKEGPAQE